MLQTKQNKIGGEKLKEIIKKIIKCLKFNLTHFPNDVFMWDSKDGE